MTTWGGEQHADTCLRQLANDRCQILAEPFAVRDSRCNIGFRTVRIARAEFESGEDALRHPVEDLGLGIGQAEAGTSIARTGSALRLNTQETTRCAVAGDYINTLLCGMEACSMAYPSLPKRAQTAAMTSFSSISWLPLPKRERLPTVAQRPSSPASR
jgi:hypothetical protein